MFRLRRWQCCTASMLRWGCAEVTPFRTSEEKPRCNYATMTQLQWTSSIPSDIFFPLQGPPNRKTSKLRLRRQRRRNLDGLLFAARHSCSWLTVCCQCNPASSSPVFARPISVRRRFSERQRNHGWSDPAGGDSAVSNPILIEDDAYPIKRRSDRTETSAAGRNGTVATL